jgi:hypothetical protein
MAALTEAELTDARRFLGYAAHGAMRGGATSAWFYQASAAVDARLGMLSESEVEVLRGYLRTLAQMEAAIPAVAEGLDTASAAGWVTDGTDVAANYALFYGSGGYPVLLTARYSGSLGNQIGVALQPGSAAGTWRLTLGLPGQVAETFDNLAAPTPAALWQNLVNAVNLGVGPLRGPSQLCVASLGSATATQPAGLSGQSLLNGSDGAAGVSAATLIGQDGLPRRGMYALRGQGCSLMVLADADDLGWWATQAGFAQQEGLYAVLNVLLGTLGAMATNVVGYWVGSSVGSARKDDRLAEVARIERTAQPPA